jgi:hypothetical protein
MRMPVRLGTIFVCLVLVINAETVAAGSWECRAQPVEPCFKRHGRLSSQNGIALMIWLTGTRRIVRLENDIDDDVPPVVQKYLEITSMNHSYIYGDFDICPLEQDVPGHMRSVCVTGAENLVVQNLRRIRPPFRLLSTWRVSGADRKGLQ